MQPKRLFPMARNEILGFGPSPHSRILREKLHIASAYCDSFVELKGIQLLKLPEFRRQVGGIDLALLAA